MMKKNLVMSFIAFISSLALPALAAPKNFNELIRVTIIGGILKPLVPFLVGLAVVIFIYGVITIMLSEGGDKKEEGKKYMLWGIVGIFVMVSIWGLVAILQGTFGFYGNETPQVIQMRLP
jgi:hypothetical protein